MQPTAPQLTASRVLLALTCAGLAACSGGRGIQVQNPISVYLPVSTVEITQGAMSVTIPIQIDSPSETALVSVSGLPGGVEVSYAASDTNPSGTLTIAATKTAMTGSYVPTVTVNSAGQTAATQFTLVVKSS